MRPKQGEMSTTRLVAISNQVRHRNECYKQFVKGSMLRKHSNKGMGKGCVKMAQNDQIYLAFDNDNRDLPRLYKCVVFNRSLLFTFEC